MYKKKSLTTSFKVVPYARLYISRHPEGIQLKFSSEFSQIIEGMKMM